MEFEIIVATDEENGIGINNTLAWHLPSDLKHFKTITTTAPEGKQNAVIMGRKTYESIPEKYRPLPERANIILTKNPAYTTEEKVLIAHTIDDALNQAKNQPNHHKTYIIGGATIYKEAIHHPACEALHITTLHHTYNCDAFFPNIPSSFQQIETTPKQAENQITYSFSTWKKTI